MWGCAKHWKRLPAALRKRIWHAYRQGQESDMATSADYIAAVRAVQDWISSQAPRDLFGPAP